MPFNTYSSLTLGLQCTNSPSCLTLTYKYTEGRQPSHHKNTHMNMHTNTYTHWLHLCTHIPLYTFVHTVHVNSILLLVLLPPYHTAPRLWSAGLTVVTCLLTPCSWEIEGRGKRVGLHNYVIYVIEFMCCSINEYMYTVHVRACVRTCVHVCDEKWRVPGQSSYKKPPEAACRQ